jgi:hypothetical protein
VKVTIGIIKIDEVFMIPKINHVDATGGVSDCSIADAGREQNIEPHN